jgi:hypothetical protein
MAKMFTKKQIEKLFLSKYPEGDICLQGKKWWYTINLNSKCINLRCNNLYDVAEILNLVDIDIINKMKKDAGYYSYQ